MIRTAVIAPVLVLGVLALAGCGRKGSLEAPPSAAITQPAGPTANEVPTTDAEGRPLAPAGKKKQLPIDWILD